MLLSSLRARLTLWYIGLLTGMLVLLGVVALILLERGLRDNMDASLESVALSIAKSVRGPTRPGVDLQEALESVVGPRLADRLFRVLDPLGRPDPRVVPRGQVQLPLSPQAWRNAERGRKTYQTMMLPEVSASPVRVLTLPVVEAGRVIRLVQVGMPLENAEATRSHFLLILVGLIPLAVVGAGAGGWFLARRALAPVDTMVQTARRIGAEDLSQRLARGRSDDELTRLAEVLNDMLARLERSFDTVRHFSADAAHELRTPLTILKGEMEVALRSSTSEEEYRRVLGSCLEEVDRLGGMVSDLLLLARSDGGHLSFGRTPVNLADILDEVSGPLQALAEPAGIDYRASAPSSVVVSGNKPMLFRAVFNLAENAIKYVGRGGKVSVTLSQEGHEARLDIRDNGPGIPPEDQPHIFDRFYRADPARRRGGTGLGLALARSIVLAHGGRLSVQSTPGEGSCFLVSIPTVDRLQEDDAADEAGPLGAPK